MTDHPSRPRWRDRIGQHQRLLLIWIGFNALAIAALAAYGLRAA